MSEEGFGDRLRRLKRARKLNNEQIALAADVHVKTVSQWMSGHFAPTSDERLRRVAELLGVDVAHLKYGASEETRSDEEPYAVPSVLQSRLPPDAYSFVYARLQDLAASGASTDQMLVAERLFLDDTFATLNKRDRSPMSADRWLKKVRADWIAMQAAMAAESEE